MLGEWAAHAGEYGENARGLMVRRKRVDLVDTIERSKQLYKPLGAEYNGSEKVWTFPDGARLLFAYLERDEDADNYQGHNYTRVYVEEIGQFPSDKPVLKLIATLRSGAGVPCKFRATGNPGGAGHQWVKARYIDPAPNGYSVQQREFTNPFTKKKITKDWVFIPSKVVDNHKIDQDDYIAGLQMAGDEELVRAWLAGDWDIVVGAYFKRWRKERHVVEPFTIPKHWTRFRSFDWGSAAPFSVIWYAVASEDHPIDGKIIPTNALICYREWYGASGPNQGLHMDADAVSLGIKKRETGDNIAYGVADPACFAQDGGPSIIERMNRAYQGNWRSADNKRIPGWDQVRQRLVGHDGKPMLYVFDTCTDIIRTLPAVQHDENKPEDVDTDGEDHAADSLRYGCMSRPYTKPKPAEPQEAFPKPTFNDLLEQAKKQRRSESRW